MVRILSSGTVDKLVELESLLEVIEDGIKKQGRGMVERPSQPDMDVGIGLLTDIDERTGNILIQSGYVHGHEYYGVKIASVHPQNRDRGFSTVNVVMAMMDATTGVPEGFADWTHPTNVKTGCVGGLAARELAIEPVHLTIFGAGAQARWQARAIAATTNVDTIRIYSPSDSKFACASELEEELSITTTAVASPREAVEQCNVLVTATTAEQPVYSGKHLKEGTLVIGIGAYSREMHELDSETFGRSASVFADAPPNVSEVGEVVAAGVSEQDLIPFSKVLSGNSGRKTSEEILVFESAGSAIFDVVVGEYVLNLAEKKQCGNVIEIL